MHCYLSAPWLVPGRAPPLVSGDAAGLHETAVLLLFTAVLSAVLSGKTEGARGGG